MRTWRRTTRKEAYLVVSKIACDRCGKEMERVTGAPLPDWSSERIGGRVSIVLRDPKEGGNAGKLRYYDGHLCEKCSEELVNWVGVHGRGPGLVASIGHMPEMAIEETPDGEQA